MKIILILSFLMGVSAFGYEIGPVGVISSYAQTSYTQTTSTTNFSVTPSSAIGYGGGIASSFPLNANFDLEIRAFYINQSIKNTFTGTASGFPVSGSMTSNAPFVMVPLLINLRVGQMLGLHAGGYYGIATGTSSSTTTSTVLGVTTSTNSSSSNTINDYGAVGGIQFKPGLSANVNLLISADYYYGFANLNSGTTGAGTSTGQSIQGTVGFLFKM